MPRDDDPDFFLSGKTWMDTSYALAIMIMFTCLFRMWQQLQLIVRLVDDDHAIDSRTVYSSTFGLIRNEHCYRLGRDVRTGIIPRRPYTSPILVDHECEVRLVVLSRPGATNYTISDVYRLMDYMQQRLRRSMRYAEWFEVEDADDTPGTSSGSDDTEETTGEDDDASPPRPGDDASPPRPGDDASPPQPGNAASPARPGNAASSSRPGNAASTPRSGYATSLLRTDDAAASNSGLGRPLLRSMCTCRPRLPRRAPEKKQE